MITGTRNRRESLRAAGAFTATDRARKALASPPKAITTRAKVRGARVDAARVPENLAYYRRFIPWQDPVVWGDLVLNKEPGVLPSLDNSIVIMDWNTGTPLPFLS